MREIKFRAWDKHNKRWIDRVLASRYKDGPCSIVWDDSKKDWLNFDEFCGPRSFCGNHVHFIFS